MKHSATVIGLDIAKHVFYAVGVDERGHEVLKRKMTRNQVLEFFANLPAAKVGIEACAAPTTGLAGSTRWGMRSG